MRRLQIFLGIYNVRRLYCRVLSKVSMLERLGIIHGDLDSFNILVSKDLQVYIIDLDGATFKKAVQQYPPEFTASLNDPYFKFKAPPREWGVLRYLLHDYYHMIYIGAELALHASEHAYKSLRSICCYDEIFQYKQECILKQVLGDCYVNMLRELIYSREKLTHVNNHINRLLQCLSKEGIYKEH